MGQRPISNVVDATNLVLFEFGQPLHAFDRAKLAGPAIRIRRARPGETLTTLDGKPRDLDPEMLVIADRDRPVAIAGVMGGADSEVTEATTTLLLECAWFAPRRVRRGARRLGLTTEASKRFERGVDPRIGPAAVVRFLEVLRLSCPDLAVGAVTDRIARADEPRPLTLRGSRVRRVTGLDVPAEQVAGHLRALEFGVEPGEPLRVTVPSWRPDVELEDDLVEEVARSVGYDMIPEVELETGGTYATRSAREQVVERARRAMLARGLNEAWCGTLVSEREAVAAATPFGRNADSLVRLMNPMSREGEVLRPNLLPGLLRATAHNLRQGAPAVRLFEVGNGFAATGGALPEETLMLGAVVTGASYRHAHTDARVSSKDSAVQLIDFEGARGLWDAWLEEMRVDVPRWRAYSGLGWKTGASAEVASNTSRIGWAGTLGPTVLREWEIDQPVHLFLALLEPVHDSVRPPRIVIPGRYPPLRRDLAFFVPQQVTHQELEQALARAAGEWLARIELFDIYAGPGTPAGMKSMAYALQFRHPERTLTEVEVLAVQERIVAAIVKDFGGRLRER
jgi:phenylalanyl-tRNA synthetase beta chain